MAEKSALSLSLSKAARRRSQRSTPNRESIPEPRSRRGWVAAIGKMPGIRFAETPPP